MSYVMREGTMPAVALYSSCEDELWAKAELEILAEDASKARPGQAVLAFLDVGKEYLTVGKFKAGYRDDYQRYRRLVEARERIIRDGWNYPLWENRP